MFPAGRHTRRALVNKSLVTYLENKSIAYIIAYI